jgi:DNA-binding MarR family transcriptional regulator
VNDRADAALVAMRRVLRATDLHARRLARASGLTASQVIVLQHLARPGDATAGDVARAAGLSQATVTALLDKLEARGLAARRRGEEDRRRVWIEITEAGRAALADAPDLLQHAFAARFAALPDWEQASLVAALERVAALLDAGDLDAAPLLDTGAADRGVAGETAVAE